ncbi:DNA methyltransferase [Natronococcus sp. A-GB7]|uniref:DNA methyltransferase n=1 Tax=Natronococcus sp. A-GB7 TaxID=3037649 RepID=UPI00241EB123|nr:DNA methyltransferase [Natronococcus sp. A-GB7]MDG5821892.1 DNA methyltransferase [Natronococcus sp. A-GB7]
MSETDRSEIRIERFNDGEVEVYSTDVSELYEDWKTPVTIVSDGAYGTGSFPGEPDEAAEVPEWYEEHIKAWSEHATPETTLWFWNTEEGWAEVHPILKKHGWEYRGCNIWNKGMSHIAGNSNTKRLRKFPQVTEVCVQYVKEAEFHPSWAEEPMDMQEWVISEWDRTGLTLQDANDACGVADAASRKYLTKGNLWYFPPPERMEAMVDYANKHGDPEGKPYFAPDGENPVDAEEWSHYRSKFDLDAGLTNVWDEAQLNGDERVTKDGKAKHLNQKPLKLMKRIIETTTDPGDVVWEPFGGLCTGAAACIELERQCRSAEIVNEHFDTAVKRLVDVQNQSERTRDQQQSELDVF